MLRDEIYTRYKKIQRYHICKHIEAIQRCLRTIPQDRNVALVHSTSRQGLSSFASSSPSSSCGIRSPRVSRVICFVKSFMFFIVVSTMARSYSDFPSRGTGRVVSQVGGSPFQALFLKTWLRKVRHSGSSERTDGSPTMMRRACARVTATKQRIKDRIPTFWS